MSKLGESLRLAFTNLGSNRLRTALTMLGIIIGTGAVVFLLSLGQGVQANIRQQFEQLRINQVTVYALPEQSGEFKPLTMQQVDQLGQRIAPLGRFIIMPQYEVFDTSLVYGKRQLNTTLQGVTTDYLAVNNRRVVEGRFFLPEDQQGQRRVLVLGATIATRLFGADSPVGRDIRINGANFEVIGVLSVPPGERTPEENSFVLLPLETAQVRFSGQANLPSQRPVTAIVIEVQQSEGMEGLVLEVSLTMRELRRLDPEDPDNFFVLYLGSFLASFNNIIQIFTLFLGAVAGIALLVGGIGVMNIMLVTVTERTREVGLRKAVGASEADIILLFLSEAALLSLLGGAIGVLLAFGTGQLISQLANLAVPIRLSSIVLALSISTAIGLFFGSYPAYRAAQLHPIQALRFE